MVNLVKAGAASAVAIFPRVVHVSALKIVREREADAPAREALLDRAFGPGRHLKTSARLRVGHLPAQGLSLIARDCDTDGMLGSVRLWSVALGDGRDGDGRPALLLGPLGVEPDAQGRGVGAKLMRFAIAEAAFRGAAAIILVGDPEYYARFGFSAEPMRNLRLPGPVEQRRFQGLELQPGALGGASGLVRATGGLTSAANDVAALGLAG